MNPRFDDSSFTVAIVGCGGFIGSHLLDAVLERTRWRVFGVDLDFYRLQHRLNHERCEFLCADLADCFELGGYLYAEPLHGGGVRGYPEQLRPSGGFGLGVRPLWGLARAFFHV